MKRLEDMLAVLGVACTEQAAERFRRYMELVLLWNEKVNLTAVTDPDMFIMKHFADSVLYINRPEMSAARNIVDIGTGAGFPGIPLAILMPEQQFTLIDSLGKRIRILEEIVPQLGLNNVCLRCGRAEDLARAPSLREAFDLCVSRAVARLSVLAEYCLPFLRPGGFMFAYKGASIEDELAEAQRAMDVLGGAVKEICGGADLDGEHGRRLVIVEKTGETPSKYPRRAGMPEKRPL